MAKKPLMTTRDHAAPTEERPTAGGLYERLPDGTLQLLEATEQAEPPAPPPTDPAPPAAAAEGEG